MSAEAKIQGLRISDYETIDGKPISNNRGPLCAECGKPYKRGINPEIECNCPPHVHIPGEHRPGNPGQRQAEAMEMIAVCLNKIVKLMESKDVRSSASTQAGVLEIGPAMLDLPGIPLPAVDVKANEAKKAETLARAAGVTK